MGLWWRWFADIVGGDGPLRVSNKIVTIALETGIYCAMWTCNFDLVLKKGRTTENICVFVLSEGMHSCTELCWKWGVKKYPNEEKYEAKLNFLSTASIYHAFSSFKHCHMEFPFLCSDTPTCNLFSLSLGMTWEDELMGFLQNLKRKLCFMSGLSYLQHKEATCETLETEMTMKMSSLPPCSHSPSHPEI